MGWQRNPQVFAGIVSLSLLLLLLLLLPRLSEMRSIRPSSSKHLVTVHKYKYRGARDGKKKREILSTPSCWCLFFFGWQFLKHGGTRTRGWANTRRSLRDARECVRRGVKRLALNIWFARHMKTFKNFWGSGPSATRRNELNKSFPVELTSLLGIIPSSEQDVSPFSFPHLLCSHPAGKSNLD